MDQLTAYKILGLMPGCSTEEIKEAYAALSKQYHPEEEPEKFQEIHEAYVTLTRRKRRSNIENPSPKRNLTMQDSFDSTPTFDFEENNREESLTGFHFEETENEDNNEEALNVEAIKPVENPQTPEYSFDQALDKAKKDEDAKIHELVLEAAAEFKILVSPKYKNHLKSFKAFFHDTKYEPVIRKAEFLTKLCSILEESQLKKGIYNYMVDFYRLRDKTPQELSAIGLRLYKVLDAKVGIKPKVKPGVYGGIAAGALFLFRVARPIIRQNELLTALALFAMLLIVLGWIGKKLYENHSALFAQGVVAALLMITQFVFIMFDVYGTSFGTLEDGYAFAAFIFLAAGVWLFIIIVMALIKYIKKLLHS